MDSLGDRLKEAREERGLSIDQVSRDTNISKSFIAAIEMEDFSGFPGETYVIGFIRNYSEYLGFRGDEFVTLYKNLVIQEQPLPLEELVSPGNRKKVNPVALLAGAVGAAAVAIVAVLFLSGVFSGGTGSGAALPQATRSGKSYEFNASREIFELAVRESVNLTEVTSGNDYSIRVDGVDAEKKIAWFRVEGGSDSLGRLIEVEAGGYQVIDLNLDGVNDVQLSLDGLSRSGQLTVDLDRTFVEGVQFALNDPILSDDFLAERDFTATDAVIYRAASREPVALQLTAATKSAVRYRVDGGNFSTSTEEELVLTLKEGGLFWIADRFSTALKVNGKEQSIPAQSGPSGSFFIAWKQSPGAEGYELGIYPLDKMND